MTTRQDLRNLCRRRLGDEASPYHWSDNQLNQWINDAIAELAVHLPRKASLSLECEAGVHTYDLPGDFLAPLSVEYPAGQAPPQYLSQRPAVAARFWESAANYAIQRRFDQAAASSLVISAAPSEGEQITVEYLSEHPSLDDDSDVCTLPDRHLELVVLFARAASYQELASRESADPDPTSLAMGTLELNARRAAQEFRTRLEAAKSAEAEGGWVAWGWE